MVSKPQQSKPMLPAKEEVGGFTDSVSLFMVFSPRHGVFLGGTNSLLRAEFPQKGEEEVYLHRETVAGSGESHGHPQNQSVF